MADLFSARLGASFKDAAVQTRWDFGGERLVLNTGQIREIDSNTISTAA